jgi:hypothetical protein
MSLSVSQGPPSIEWTELITQLPLFPPSAHPPPTLFPLLSPLLQQKLGLLSLGRGRGWPGTLTWLPPDFSYRVNERLKSTCRSDGLGERLRGYRKFDQETVQLNLKPSINLDPRQRRVTRITAGNVVQLGSGGRANRARVEVT